MSLIALVCATLYDYQISVNRFLARPSVRLSRSRDELSVPVMTLEMLLDAIESLLLRLDEVNHPTQF